MVEKFPCDLHRLRLRALRLTDLDDFHAYRSDPVVARYQGWELMSRAQAAEFLQTQQECNLVAGSWRQLAVAELQSDRLIGDMGVWLSHDCSRAEFGLSISSAAQGKGFGTECARGLLDLLWSGTPVKEIIACTDARNVACLALLKRAGMRHVDTRQALYKAEMCTEHVFTLGSR
jgi:RimJ/RimL family protein N-acetyltransferase